MVYGEARPDRFYIGTPEEQRREREKQMEEREPILRARIKVSPQMLKAIALLTTKHVKEYEDAVGPITLPDQVYAAWELNDEDEGEHGHAAG